MVLGRIDLHRLEHSVNMASGSSAHVLLAQAAHLHVDGHGLELVGQRHLLELHLVDGGLSAAKQRSCCEESSLHDGRLGMGDMQVMGKKPRMRDKVGNRDAMIRPSAMMDGWYGWEEGEGKEDEDEGGGREGQAG